VISEDTGGTGEVHRLGKAPKERGCSSLARSSTFTHGLGHNSQLTTTDLPFKSALVMV
jgi:hypothetical protein